MYICNSTYFMQKILFYLFLCFSLLSFSQQKLWKGYFSYNEITDVCISNQKVYSSTKNAVFNKDVSTNILTTFTSINDVKPDEITAIFQTSNNYTLIGNENGLIILIKPDGSTLNKVDIITDVPVPANSKKINDFYEYNGKVYVSTQYGITVIKLSNFEIENSFEYNKPNMKSFLENKKANITTRNFPETVENIRKKWKIKEGGIVYCFFTTDINNNKIVLLCDKLK